MYSASLQQRLCIFASLLLFVGGLTIAGCDFLDKSPKGELTSGNFFQTQDHAIQGTNATYNMLRAWQVHVFSWLGVTDIASDDATKGSTPSDASFLLELDEKTFGPGNIAFGDTWSGYYTGIYRANVAIQNIPPIDMDEQLKERLIGENKFLRAYFYFFLVRAYGGVPKITAPLKPDEFEQPRAPRDTIYALIERDLNDAIDKLPPKSQYSENQMGRATKGAAEGLLAKAHLFQEEYDEALSHAETVINSGEYALLDDYWTIFRESGEYSSESVFEIGVVARESGGGSSQYALVQSVRGSANNGWGFNQPSPDLEQSYEPGDPRHQATILHPWESLPDGSGVVAQLNPNIPNQRYNEKVQLGVDAPGGYGSNTVNIRRLRYADVLLIAAESAYQTGDESTARTYLNDVRERAREGQTVTLGLQPENMASQLAEAVGVADSGPHVFVRHADESGPAAQAGLESAAFSTEPALVETLDVLETVNGAEVTTREGYRRVLSGVSPGETIPVEITRIEQTTDQDGNVSTSTQSMTMTVTASALLPDVSASGQALLDAIWAERRAELAMEQHRYFDLIRQGRAADELADFQPKHKVYPIPQSEIDLSGGAMNQNEGY